MSESEVKVQNLGEWVITPSDKMPELLASFFSERRLGATITPLALLAEQVVSGKNYMVLCEITLATNPRVKTLSKVVVYASVPEKSEEGEEGEVEENKKVELAITSVETVLELDLVGGYTLDFAYGTLPQQLASAYNTLFEGLTGAKYEPIAYIGSQLVNGVNHMVLSKQTLATKPPEEHLAMVEVTQLAPFSIGGEFAVRSIKRLV